MGFKSKIAITFNADIPVGANIYFRQRWQYAPWSIDNYTDYNYHIVTSRAAVNEVTYASTPTATAGEKTAINFYDAFHADWPFIEISRTSNTVTIKIGTFDNVDEGLFTWVIGSSVHPDVSMVIDNVYDDTVDPPIEPVETLVLDPIAYKDFQIEIIDTYTNDRVLIDEIMSVDAATLSYDGGDTKVAAIIPSKLIFNMAVQDKMDAKFFHLFTGDEKRYMVKLTAIDEDENSELYWKGFVVPDQYNEPYQNGVFFVSFTATDNLQLQKKYTLPAWYFGSRYPLMKLISYLLKETGLNQSIIIAASLLPNQENAMANMINVPISQYKDGSKYTDNSEILKDVLEALGLSIYNFRGYWFVVGISRKHEPEVRFAEVYDVNGDFVEFARINRQIVDFFAEANPSLNAIPAYSKVNFELDVDNRLNVFPANVAKVDYKSTEYVSYEGFQNYPIGHTRPVFIDQMVAPWLKIGSSLYNLFTVENTQFIYNIGTSVETSHSMDEATALVNYFTPQGQFYVLQGFKYQLNLELTVYVKTTSIPTDDDYADYDPMVPIQFYLNGIEVYSKRPANTVANQKKYTHSLSQVAGGFEMKFKLEDEIYFRESGVLEFRLLAPIWNNASGSIPSLIKLEKLELLEETKNDYLEFISAKRPIINTVYYDQSLKFVSSSNTAIRNNFGIGYPSSPVYDWNFPTLNLGDTYTGKHQFREGASFSSVDRIITLIGKDITLELLLTLFQEGYKDFVFIKNSITGEEKPFNSLYGNLVRNFISTFQIKMGYLYDYDNQVILPEGYEKYDESLNGWDFYYRKVNYDYEIIANRDQWKLVGETSSATFLKQLAKVYMNSHPSAMMQFEGVQNELMQPDSLMAMDYNNELIYFMLTNFTLNLFGGKTQIGSAIEAKYEELTDITYK